MKTNELLVKYLDFFKRNTKPNFIKLQLNWLLPE